MMSTYLALHDQKSEIKDFTARTSISTWHAVALCTKVEFLTLIPSASYFPHQTHQVKAVQISELFACRRFNCPVNPAFLFVGGALPYTPLLFFP